MLMITNPSGPALIIGLLGTIGQPIAPYLPILPTRSKTKVATSFKTSKIVVTMITYRHNANYFEQSSSGIDLIVEISPKI